jgi:hypothetical protein
MSDDYTYDDNLKQVAWECYWEGYTLGRGVEEMSDIAKKTANTMFERMWGR